MSTSPTADRNLLFGILALQMNFVDQDALLSAMSAWTLAKEKSISQILLSQGKITAAQIRALDELIELQLRAHGNDARRGLETIQSFSSIGERLVQIVDADVQESLACLTTLSRDDPPVKQPASRSTGLRYEKERKHKHGGLGQVYVAVDTELHRKVALKEILPHRADDPASRARFVLEAEITGGLEHPGIVPVYGFGTYADGRPYYAMRFIHGTSLREAIERFHDLEKPGRDPGDRSLAFRQLLRRFVDACNAVAYAHNRGVLHRDLKPMNIMLGDFGETLVIDWGLAKAGVQSAKNAPADTEVTVDPTLRPSGSDLLVTNVGAAIGTPAFMSPEQAAGKQEQVNSASDIYGLGATLYILLTGKKPYDGTTDAEVMERVKVGQFFPPRQVKPGTPPALDAICRKAMAFKPEDRYGTALALAADIEHWLADEPVAAYPEPWYTRAARWTRRHRTAVVGTVIFLTCAVVGLSVSTLLIWREQKETDKHRQLAEKNFEQARKVSYEGFGLVAAAEPELAADPNSHAQRRRFLFTASNTMRELRARDPNDPELKKQTAKVFRYTANVHRLEGQLWQAISLYQESIALMREFAERDDQQKEVLAHLLRDLSSSQASFGQLREASDSINKAIVLIEGLLKKSSASVRLNRGLALALVSRGRIEHALGSFAEAASTAQQAEHIYANIITDAPPGDSYPYDQVLLAAAMNTAAVNERDAGNTGRALNLHRQAVDVLLALQDKARIGLNNNDVIFFLVRCGLEQCHTLALIPDQKAAIPQKLNLLIEPAIQLSETFPTIPMYRQLLAGLWTLRGRLRVEQGQAARARVDLENAHGVLSALASEYPAPGYRADLAESEIELGKLARTNQDQAKAKEWFAKAAADLELARKQAPASAGIKRTLAEAKAEFAK
jgi:eukaryotic-like serine/threonine-protein kinase